MTSTAKKIGENNSMDSFFNGSLENSDPAIYKAIANERQRQEDYLELIA